MELTPFLLVSGEMRMPGILIFDLITPALSLSKPLPIWESSLLFLRPEILKALKLLLLAESWDVVNYEPPIRSAFC